MLLPGPRAGDYHGWWPAYCSADGHENADLETVSLSTNPAFLALIERSRARHQAEGGLSSTEVRQRLGLHKSA